MNKKICGVAVNDLKYSEQYGDRKIYKKALDRWHSMINRCYNVKDKCYKTYGAKGECTYAMIGYILATIYIGLWIII